MTEPDVWRVARNLHILSALSKRVLEDGLLPPGLTFAQVSILKWLDAATPRRAGEVARFISASAPAATQILARMKRKGYVRTTRNPKDRRAEDLALTARGRGLIRKYETAKRRRLAALLHAVPASRRKAMVGGLEAAVDLLLLDGPNVRDLCLHCGVYQAPECVMRRHGYRCPTESCPA